MKKDLLNEVKIHRLSETVGEVSHHSSGTGFDLPITGISEKKVNALANQCGLERLYGKNGKLLPGEASHFQLK